MDFDLDLESLLPAPPTIVVEIGVAQGPAGTPGNTASVSPTLENRAVDDGGVFVPELRVDPLAYYILAKA